MSVGEGAVQVSAKREAVYFHMCSRRKNYRQALLEKANYTIDGEPIQWQGYYVGVLSENKNSVYNEISKRGFLFGEKHGRNIMDSVINSVTFCELLFLSTQGSTLEYRTMNSGKIEPVLDCADNSEMFSKRIQNLQNAAIQFVKDFSISLATATLDAETAAGNYEAIARVPSLETLNLFRDCNASDGYTYKAFASDYSFWYYLCHPRQFLFDFAKRPGKSWFLKSVFKIPLPYIFLLNIARRITKSD